MALGHNSKNFVSANSLSKADRKRLKNAIQELNDSMTRAAAERDFQKEAINDLSEQLGLDKKLLRRMAKTYFKANYNDEVEENSSFQEFYELVINAKEEATPVTQTDSEEDTEVPPWDDPHILRTDGWSNK